MLRLILQRIGFGVLVLWIVSVIVFVATQALPGDAAVSILGRDATPERLAALRSQLGLDRPLIWQYLDWSRGLLVGDLGMSLAARTPVADLLSSRLANSAFLVGAAAVITLPLSMFIGIVTAIRRDRLVDQVLTNTMLGLAALPEFVVGISLILIFATGLFSVLPAVSLIDLSQPLSTQLEFVLLPAATLVIAVTPYISRMMRASMIDVLESEYVQTARLKGLSERTVILRHALPNALIPAIQVAALQMAWLAGGVVLVEVVFRYPGIGEALVDAVSNRDLPVIQALTMLAGAIYVALNVVADVMTVLASPRTRTGLRRGPKGLETAEKS